MCLQAIVRMFSCFQAFFNISRNLTLCCAACWDTVFPHILLDRMAFLKRDADRLTVQKVPASIYPASYPAWFFSESRLQAEFTNAGYVLVADFQCPYELSPDDEKAYHKGFIFEKRDVQPGGHETIKQ
jgi:putative methyltransferase (TIGR04325 family)